MTKITRRKNGYSVISNTALRDKRLSARAKGVYAYIMTLPEDWQIYKEELYTHFTEGRDALNKAIKELISIGYMETIQTKDKGKFGCNEYIIKDTADGEPFTEKPRTVTPMTENPQLLNTEELSTDKVITDNTPYSPPQNSEEDKIRKEVVNHLNDKIGTSYRPGSQNTKRHISARIREGYSLEDFKSVIDFKVKEWVKDPKMRQYLRPETLFSAKFEGYFQAAKGPKEKTEYEKIVDRARELAESRGETYIPPEERKPLESRSVS